ncbi:MAG: ester cyclase [Bacteroidia bacterium]|nr:ester cyclase [Bacteroidia bacterium]
MKPHLLPANCTVLALSAFTAAVFHVGYLPSFGQDLALHENNATVIVRYFDEVINAHNLSRKGAFFQEPYIWHTMDGRDVRSDADSGHTAALRWVFTAMPDVQYTLVHILAQGDMVAVNTAGTGTARSEMFGLPAAQKKVHFQQMFFYRLSAGKIIEQWEAIDAGGIRAQLEAK